MLHFGLVRTINLEFYCIFPICNECLLERIEMTESLMKSMPNHFLILSLDLADYSTSFRLFNYNMETVRHCLVAERF